MRETIHVVSRRDYWPFAVAIRAAAARVVAPRAEAPPAGARPRAPGGRAAGAAWRTGRAGTTSSSRCVGRSWGMVGPWLELVRVPPSGTWEKRRAHLFQTAERWVGPEDVGRRPALDHLVRRYLARSGRRRARTSPGGRGMKPGDIAPALERLPLRRFRDEAGGELLDVPRAPLPDPETPAPVRFLPDLGRRPPRPRAPDGCPPRGVSAADLLDEDAAVGRHLPRRRRRRRHVALRRRPHPLGAVRPPRPRAPGARSRTRPSGLRCSTPDNTMAA